MSERMRNRRDTSPLNGPEPEDDAKLRELRGELPLDEQDGAFPAEQIEDAPELTDSEIYLGELEDGESDTESEGAESLEVMTELELRDDETDDPFLASDEGLSYIPPIDPPTVPSNNLAGVEIASGFGASALDEPFDSDHHSDFEYGDDEMAARVAEAIRADSATTQYAESIHISVSDGIVTLRGEVLDLEDADNLLAVAGYVEGVDEVVDKLRVRSLGG